MTISPTAVRFDEHTIWVGLSDGCILGVPLAWFPRLLRATSQQREHVELSPTGLHWEEIDEDISVASLLAGRSDMTGGRGLGHRPYTGAIAPYSFPAMSRVMPAAARTRTEP